MNLRPFQDNMVTNLARKLKRFRKLVGQLATGGGKTVIFSAVTSRYLAKSPDKAVLILVHRKELLSQTRKTAFNAFKLTCTPIVAGMKYIPPAQLYVGMVETVNRRINKLPANIGLVIIDECHRLEFVKLHQYFPEQYIIGFTATPLTASKKKPLKDYYDGIVCGIDIPELISQGYLCQNITWAPKDTVDRMELAIKNGEFDDGMMAQAFSKPRYIHNTVTAYSKWAKDTKAIVFNVNIDHSKVVARAFKDAGYPCEHLDSEMGKLERERILAWFTATPNAILCNIGIATTGYDEPTIETVIINKATLSMPLWLQMCGRGSRPIPHRKSAFTIIDMGGNALAHGDWCQSRNWEQIFHDPPKPGKPTTGPVKSCPQCDAIIPAASTVCPYCGFIYEKQIEVEVQLHDFIVVTKNIDVDKIMRENATKKEYYPLFKIGTELAEEALQAIPVMQDDYAIFIAQIYYDLAKVWAHKRGKKFNKFIQIKCKEHLIQELKVKYPKWQTEIKVVNHERSIENLKQLENLKPL